MSYQTIGSFEGVYLHLCDRCGGAVFDVEAHDRFHDDLPRAGGALASRSPTEKKTRIRNT